LVGEPHALQHRRHVVLAVGADCPDDEGEVDLRVGKPLAHARDRSSSTNSSGASASALVAAGRPSAASASAARARSAVAPSSSEFGSVFLRWANAPSTTRLISPKRAGSGLRTNATRAESTFGRGRKTLRETGWKPVRSVASWTSTETAPYAFVPDSAKK